MQIVRSGADFSESARKSQVCIRYFYFGIRIIKLHPGDTPMMANRAQTLNQSVFSSLADTQDNPAALHARAVAQDFVRQGWAVRDNFLAAARWRELAAEAQQLWEQGAFHQAGVGREPTRRVQPGIRGDYTLWLDPQLTPAACRFVACELEALRCALNAGAFLGVFEFEGHLAMYPAGAGYERHLDQLQGTQARRVSVVVYLNEAWQNGDGGELCLYPDEQAEQSAADEITILPRGGTLVVFASADTAHEVRPARRTRVSLSGWLRCRA